MKYLIKTTEIYRCDSEGEAEKLIESQKNEFGVNLARYSSTHKERKSKGEIIDEWYHVELTKVFDDEKEPEGRTNINYTFDTIGSTTMMEDVDND